MSYCFILRNSRNIFVKTASFYLERLEGYGVLKKCTTFLAYPIFISIMKLTVIVLISFSVCTIKDVV